MTGQASWLPSAKAYSTAATLEPTRCYIRATPVEAASLRQSRAPLPKGTGRRS